AEHRQLVHHPGGIGGRMSAEGPTGRVTEAVARTDWRVKPAGRGQPYVIRQVRSRWALWQALESDVRYGGRNHACCLAANDRRRDPHRTAGDQFESLEREKLAVDTVGTPGPRCQQPQ